MKTIRVDEVYRLHGTAMVSVPEDVPLEHVISRLAHEPNLRPIFLVDVRQRFTGLITRAKLIEWTHLQISGGQGRHEISVYEILQILEAKKAKDIVSGDPQALAVKETDTLQDALDKMLNHKEDVLPVLDSEGRILGDLRISEVLLKVIEVGQQARGVEPA